MRSVGSLRRRAIPLRRITINWKRQAEMLTERRAFILTPQQAARLKDRHDMIDENIELVRQGFEQDKAVSTVIFEPKLQTVGDLFRRADEIAARSGKTQSRLAQREVFRARGVDDFHGLTLIAVPADSANIRERRIEIVDREVMIVEGAAEHAQCVLDRDKRGKLFEFRFGLDFGRADHRADAR